MSTNPTSQTSGPNIELNLYSMFASKKKSLEREHFHTEQTANMAPSNFQVSANIEEETRRDSQLSLSFVVTLNDSKGLVTYEFRGKCRIHGSSAEFSSLLEAEKNKVPKILDIIYQRLYPMVFMMSGSTSAPYPQSVTLGSQMMAPANQVVTPPTAEEKIVQTIKANNNTEGKKENAQTVVTTASRKSSDKSTSNSSSENKKGPVLDQVASISSGAIGQMPTLTENAKSNANVTKDKAKSTAVSA